MSEIKVIDNILPFNDVFYKNCFYNSLFPVITHFNENILSILLNDIIIYSNPYKDDITSFGISYLNFNTLENILVNIGIEMKSLYYREDLINNVKLAIKEDKPVIIRVDCFYESLRKDLYKRNHWPHTLLIHGYNEDESAMYIIEHNNKDNLNYDNRTISYEDIKNSYEGYYKNFGSACDLQSYFEFSLNKSLNKCNFDIDMYKKFFVRNTIEKESEILYGFEKLKNFAENFEHIVLNEEMLNKKVDDLIKSFNIIINAKQVEVYRISKLFGNQHNMVKLQQEIVQHWSIIRGIVAKYKFSNMYNQQNFINLFDKFKMILETEMLYLEKIKISII